MLSHEEREKRGHISRFNSEGEKRGQFLLGQLYRDRLQRENTLDTGED